MNFLFTKPINADQIDTISITDMILYVEKHSLPYDYHYKIYGDARGRGPNRVQNDMSKVQYLVILRVYSEVSIWTKQVTISNYERLTKM